MATNQVESTYRAINKRYGMCSNLSFFNIIFFFSAKWRQNCHFELWHAFFVSGGFIMCNNDRTLKYVFFFPRGRDVASVY